MVSNLSSDYPTRLPLDLDYQTTTPCAKAVIAAMEPYWEKDWNNASNRQNQSGLKASAAVNLAREKLSKLLKVDSTRIIFTSGATESNNIALLGHARAKAEETGQPGHIISLQTEHLSVLNPLRQLKREGFRITELMPSPNGLITKDSLEKAIRKDTFMMSIMMANNEIGVIQPISKIARLCKERGIILHSDSAQAFGYMELEPDSIGLDLVSLSSHKIYGPKGIGALVISEGVKIQPLQWGGNQEIGLRPGTLAVPLIIGYAKAAEIAMEELPLFHQELKSLRNELWNNLKSNIPSLILNGSLEKRLPHNLNFTIPGIQGSELHRRLRNIISCSSGSACSNGAPSHVLQALGRSKKEAEASIRLSLGRNTTSQDVSQALKELTKIIHSLQN